MPSSAVGMHCAQPWPPLPSAVHTPRALLHSLAHVPSSSLAALLPGGDRIPVGSEREVAPAGDLSGDPGRMELSSPGCAPVWLLPDHSLRSSTPARPSASGLVPGAACVWTFPSTDSWLPGDGHGPTVLPLSCASASGGLFPKLTALSLRQSLRWVSFPPDTLSTHFFFLSWTLLHSCYHSVQKHWWLLSK